MRLLLKLLRPDTVPSPNRKNIPFGTRVQLALYRKCLTKAMRRYAKLAFSDGIVLEGRPSVRILHEFRDVNFEAEVKRMRLVPKDVMVECAGTTSHWPDRDRSRGIPRYFHFKDTFSLVVDGQKTSIEHGDGRSFVSAVNGRLKETDAAALYAKYIFSASRRGVKQEASVKESLAAPATPAKSAPDTTPSVAPTPSVASATADRPATAARPAKKRTGPLFGGDPLLKETQGPASESPKPAAPEPVKTIKKLAGVEIDDSF